MSTIIKDTLVFDTEYDNILVKFSISENVITKIENGKSEEVFLTHLSFRESNGRNAHFSIDEIDFVESFFKRCKYLVTLNGPDFINEISKNKKSNKSDIDGDLKFSNYSLFKDDDCVVSLKHQKLIILGRKMDRPQVTIAYILKLIENMKKLKQ